MRPCSVGVSACGKRGSVLRGAERGVLVGVGGKDFLLGWFLLNSGALMHDLCSGAFFSLELAAEEEAATWESDRAARSARPSVSPLPLRHLPCLVSNPSPRPRFHYYLQKVLPRFPLSTLSYFGRAKRLIPPPHFPLPPASPHPNLPNRSHR